MPRLNGTGPMGQGPITGWGRGPCGGERNGLGFWGGVRNNFRRFVSPKNELSALEEEEQALERELAVIREEKEAIKNRHS